MKLKEVPCTGSFAWSDASQEASEIIIYFIIARTCKL